MVPVQHIRNTNTGTRNECAPEYRNITSECHEWNEEIKIKLRALLASAQNGNGLTASCFGRLNSGTTE